MAQNHKNSQTNIYNKTLECNLVPVTSSISGIEEQNNPNKLPADICIFGDQTGTDNIVINKRPDWEAFTYADNDTIEQKYGYKLRNDSDSIYITPEGPIWSKKPKSNAPLAYFEAQHELLGNYISSALNDSVTPTFLLKSNDSETFTIASFIQTPWTVKNHPEKIEITSSEVTDKSALKKNWITRHLLHDSDANDGHVCLIFSEGEIKPYFIDFAYCFTGYGGKNYEIAMSGVGKVNSKGIFGADLISDFRDLVVMKHISKIDKLDISKIERKSININNAIIKNYRLNQQALEKIEENRQRCIEIIKYRKENLRSWIEKEKPIITANN